MVNRAIAGEPITLFGDGAYLRDFTHLEDVVEAFRLAIEAPGCPRPGRHYVITSGRGETLARGVRAYRRSGAAMCRPGAVEMRRVEEPRDHASDRKAEFRRQFPPIPGIDRMATAPFDLKAGIRQILFLA